MKKRWYSIITLIGSLFMMLALIPNSYSKYKTTYDVGDINIGIDYDNLINVTSGKKWDGYGGFVSLTDATNYACTENPILLRVGDIVTFTFPLNKNYNFSYYLKTSDSHSTDAIYVNSGWLTPTSDNTYSFTLTSPQTLLSNSVSVDITSCFLAVNMYVGDGSLPIDETTAEDMKKCISVTRNTDVSNYREVAVTYGNTEYDITGLPTSVLYGEDLKVEFLEGITIEDLTIYEAGTEVNIVNSTNVHSGKYTYNSTRHILYVSNVTNPIQIDIALKPCYLSYEGLDITNLPTECAFGSSIDIDLNNKDVNFVEVVDGNGDPIPLNDGTSGNVFNQFTNILHLNKVTSDLKIISYSIGLGSATLSFANGIDYKWERRQTGYFWNKYYVFDKSQKNTGHISSDQLNIKPGDSIRVLDSYVNGKPYYFSINVLIYTLNNNDATFIDINNDGNYDNNDDVWVGHNNEFSISYDDIISILGGPTTDNIYLAFNIVKKDPESTDGSYYIQETFSADLIEEASEYIVINDKSIYSTAVRSLNPGDTYTIVHSDTFDFSYSFFTLDTNNQFVKVAENSVPTGDTTMTYKNARSIANLTDPTQKLYAVLTFAKKDSTEVTLTDKYTIMTTLVTYTTNRHGITYNDTWSITPTSDFEYKVNIWKANGIKYTNVYEGSWVSSNNPVTYDYQTLAVLSNEQTATSTLYVSVDYRLPTDGDVPFSVLTRAQVDAFDATITFGKNNIANTHNIELKPNDSINIIGNSNIKSHYIVLQESSTAGTFNILYQSAWVSMNGTITNNGATVPSIYSFGYTDIVSIDAIDELIDTSKSIYIIISFEKLDGTAFVDNDMVELMHNTTFTRTHQIAEYDVYFENILMNLNS